MLPTTIKLFFIFLCTIYIQHKLINETFNKSGLKIFVTCMLLTAISSLLNWYYSELTYLIPIILAWLIKSILTTQPQKCFVATTIAFVISFSLHAVISLTLTLLFYPIYPEKENFPFITLAVISAILQYLLTLLLFSIKRFRKGMPFLISINYINIATFISIILMAFSTYVTFNHHDSELEILGFVATILVLAFLIYWWQAQITKSYRRSLELRELESLRTEVVEKDILIQKLLKENDRLATITHRDNTLISTLTNATRNYLMTDYANPAVAIETRDSLISNIKKLSDGRLSLPDDYNEKKARNFETGISLMNDMLHNMDEDAIKMNITFSVHVGVMLKDFVPQDISEMDLVHLVDDLLKNAFKATKSSEPRVVQLQFYKVGKHFVVEVADSGIPFEVKSLVNMGIEKMTTYEDGSGIGLMDIWKTKENCRATYHIEEYDTPAPFTKKISLTFDGKNRYSIRTSRKDEILQMSKRADLQVYGYEE